MNFQLQANFKPTGDQPQAIKKLTDNLLTDSEHQVLLGVTGSGKTFSIANVIANINRPTLVISHNKTLAAQLYQEFRDFFPKNAVSYFVSYYDYYQPEAYIPQTDTYIEKETEINEDIDRLRLEATTNLLTRKDVIVVSSVSSIYNLGSPREYGNYVINLKIQEHLEINQLISQLVDLQYIRSDYELRRGNFRVRGEMLFIWPAYSQNCLRIEFGGKSIKKMHWINPVDGKILSADIEHYIIYPAKHYMVNPDVFETSFSQIRRELGSQLKKFENKGKIIEAHRLKQRVEYDLEMIKEFGYVKGIENYSRFFDGRKPGQAPYSLLEYFPKDYLLVIDESHMTIPQIRGMSRGDKARKEVLIDFGFRLPSAYDNRPLNFEEFQRRQSQTIYVSATPADWELEKSGPKVIQQLVRPTAIVDAEVEVRKTQGQIPNLVKEIKNRKKLNERVLVTTLTKRLAEELTAYLSEKESSLGLKVNYLHSEVQTLDRQDILDDLRTGVYDVIIGINLLREGLDLPEVSLVAILDADKEGFLRSKTSLVQTMGRAARHPKARVILYADRITDSMKEAMEEVSRRREYQLNWNKIHNLTPIQIKKPIREKLTKRSQNKDEAAKKAINKILQTDFNELTPQDQKKHLKYLHQIMLEAAKNLDFEKAAQIRDGINKLKEDYPNL